MEGMRRDSDGQFDFELWDMQGGHREGWDTGVKNKRQRYALVGVYILKMKK